MQKHAALHGWIVEQPCILWDEVSGLSTNIATKFSKFSPWSDYSSPFCHQYVCIFFLAIGCPIEYNFWVGFTASHYTWPLAQISQKKKKNSEFSDLGKLTPSVKTPGNSFCCLAQGSTVGE